RNCQRALQYGCPAKQSGKKLHAEWMGSTFLGEIHLINTNATLVKGAKRARHLWALTLHKVTVHTVALICLVMSGNGLIPFLMIIGHGTRNNVAASVVVPLMIRSRA